MPSISRLDPSCCGHGPLHRASQPLQTCVLSQRNSLLAWRILLHSNICTFRILHRKYFTEVVMVEQCRLDVLVNDIISAIRGSGGRTKSRPMAPAMKQSMSFTSQHQHRHYTHHAHLTPRASIAGICHLRSPLSAANPHDECSKPLCIVLHHPRNTPIDWPAAGRVPDPLQHLQLQQCQCWKLSSDCALPGLCL